MGLFYRARLRLLVSLAWLLALQLAAVGPAIAQGTAIPQGVAPPPEPMNLDERGVSLTAGQVIMDAVDLTIGPADHRGLQFTRQWVSSGWRISNLPTMSGSTTNPIVSYRGRSIPFKTVSGGYVPEFENGATLSNDRTVYTAPDGTVVNFMSTRGVNFSWALGSTTHGRATKLT